MNSIIHSWQNLNLPKTTNTMSSFTAYTISPFLFHTHTHSLSRTTSSLAHLVAEHVVMVIGVPVAIGDVTDAVLAEGGGSERVSTIAVDLRTDTAAEGEGGQGVVVCDEDHGVDQLCQGPAVLLCLKKVLEGERERDDVRPSAKSAALDK